MVDFKAPHSFHCQKVEFGNFLFSKYPLRPFLTAPFFLSLSFDSPKTRKKIIPTTFFPLLRFSPGDSLASTSFEDLRRSTLRVDFDCVHWIGEVVFASRVRIPLGAEPCSFFHYPKITFGNPSGESTALDESANVERIIKLKYPYKNIILLILSRRRAIRWIRSTFSSCFPPSSVVD